MLSLGLRVYTRNHHFHGPKISDGVVSGQRSADAVVVAGIYRRTRNLRAVQLLLGHTKLQSTVRYLGIEVDDALEIAEQTDV